MKTFRALLPVAAVLATAVAAAPTAPLTATDSAAAPAVGAHAGTAHEDGSGPMGAGYHEEIYFPSLDGTMLHADVLLPAPPDEAPEGGWPVIVSMGPYFSAAKTVPTWSPTATGPEERFADFIVGAEIFANGYAWAQVDSRGYGASAGCNDLGGIGEQMDMFATVEHFGEAEWSNGRVGTWGKSYDAWTQVMGVAMNPPHLAAAVIQAPLIEGYRFVYDNGVHFDAGWYLSPSLYLLYDELPHGPADSGPEEVIWSTESTARAAECWPESEANHTANHDHDSAFWQERDLKPRASASMVPQFWTMGFQDVNTKPTNLIDVYENLRGYHKGWFGHWAHVRGNEVHREDFFVEVMDFLDVNLKGKPAYELDVNADQQVRVQTQLGDWYVADGFPASDVEMFELELLGGTYTDSNDNVDEAGDGVWTFTEPFPHTAHFSGEPRFHVQASGQLPNANLLTRVYVVGEDGRADLVSRGAMLLEQDGTTGQGATVTFDGWPSDFVIQEGERLAVVLTSTDAEHQPLWTGGEVEITTASVELPFRTIDSVYDEYTETQTPPYAERLQVSLFESRTQSGFVFPPAAN